MTGIYKENYLYPTRPCADCRGFSLLEVLIAVAVFMVVLIAVYGLMMASQETYTTSKAVASLEVRARRALDRIADELQDAGVSQLVPLAPIAPFGTNQLAFRKNTGYDTVTETITWSDPFAVRLDTSGDPVVLFVDMDGAGMVQDTEVLARGVRSYAEGETLNGADDNGNGLIDEEGLSFELVGNTVVVRITLEGTDENDRLFAASSETAVRLRN